MTTLHLRRSIGRSLLLVLAFLAFPFLLFAIDLSTAGSIPSLTPTPTPGGPPLPPVANPATFVASNSFTANWSRVSGATGYRLDVATDSSFINYVTGYQNLNVGNAISRSVTGLNASTTYHYRVRSYNGMATSGNSNVINVTTLSPTGSPVVTTNPATNVASFSATLNGSVDPHGLTTTVYFQYGTTTNYGLTTLSQSKSGNTYQTVSANISSLTVSTTYHFRIVATNSAGTVHGADRTFTTLSATGAPVVITNPATNVLNSSATLNGTVDPHGLITSVQFQYGRTTGYGSITASQMLTGNTYHNLTATISGLLASTTYHFRIVAGNSAGTTHGGDRTFTTPAACSWITRAPVPYNATGIFAVSDGTYLYAGGGHDANTARANLQRYNPGTNTWTNLAPSPDQHSLSQAVFYNNKIYNIGGFGTNGGALTNTVRIYDISTNSWSIGAPMPVALTDMATVLWNGKIYVAAGFNGFGPVNTLYAYDISTNTWRTLAPMPQALFLPGFGAIGGKLYIASGNNGSSELNTLYVYNIATNSWSTGTVVPTPVTAPGSTVLCGKLYLYGGGYPNPHNITQIYDPVGNSWSSGRNLNVARLWFYGSAVGNIGIVAPGGNTAAASTSAVNTNEQLVGCPCP